jgi:hypothetical protein
MDGKDLPGGISGGIMLGGCMDWMKMGVVSESQVGRRIEEAGWNWDIEYQLNHNEFRVLVWDAVRAVAWYQETLVVLSER